MHPTVSATLVTTVGTTTGCPTCTCRPGPGRRSQQPHGSEHNGTDRGGFSATWSSPKIFEEDAWQVSAAQIKAQRPNTTVVVWMDSLRIYTADKALNPDFKGPCAQGYFRPAEFLESGGKMDKRRPICS